MVSPDDLANHPEAGHGGRSRRRSPRLTDHSRPAPIEGAGVPCRGACPTLRRPLDGGLQQAPIYENGGRLCIPRYVATSPPQGDAGAVRGAARLLVDHSSGSKPT